MLRIVAALCVAASVQAQSVPQWAGLVQNAPGDQVTVHALGRNGEAQAQVAAVSVGGSEAVPTDAFRCVPYGTHCVFATNDPAGTARLYNVSVADGSLVSMLEFPGTKLHNLAIYYKKDQPAYTQSIAMDAAGTTRVVAIASGKMSTILDLTSIVGPHATIPPGGATQCSDADIMWLMVRNSTGLTSIVQVDMASRQLMARIELVGPPPASLWSICIDSTKQYFLAGAAQNGSTIAYGRISAQGEFNALSTGQLPSAEYQLTAMLSIPEPRNGYFMAAYPVGSPIANGTSGYLAFGDQNNRYPLTLEPIDYFLRGASAIY